MANDVEITVRVKQSGSFASVSQDLRNLKGRAQDSSQALRTLSTRTSAAGLALRVLGNGAQEAERALVGLRAVAGDIKVKAKIDNETRAGIAAVRSAIRDLKNESPVRLEATFDGQTADITAAARAMRDLKGDARQAGQALDGLTPKAAAAAVALNALQNAAEDASRALRTLRGRAAAAAAAMAELRAATTSASNSMRTFANRADSAHGRLGDLSDRSRTLRSDMDDLDGVLGRVGAGLNGLRGRLGSVSTSAGRSDGSMRGLIGTALALSTALLPIAAAAAPVAGTMGAAAVAMGAFGAAVVPQIGRLADAVSAQVKYSDAVRTHGAASKQAATASLAMQDSVSRMTPATREAAAGFMAVKESTREWSDALSSSTMPVFTKSFATFRAMLPSFTPLVAGAASELDKFVTTIAGGVNSAGYDEFMAKFGAFATGALKSVLDGIIRLSRSISGFVKGGGLDGFMEYARANGPLVAETLRNIGSAIVHLVASSGDLGVTMLTVVNSFAKLVNALPKELISTVLQLYAAFKLFGLAAAGIAAVGAAVSGMGAALVSFRVAAVAAGGGIAGLRAAFLALSTAAKTTVAVAGITVLFVALQKLSQIGKAAPADIDQLTTSMGKLANTGRASGEAARVFGSDLGKLGESLRTLARPSNLDKTQQFLTQLIGMDSTPVKDAKANFQAMDEALTNMVKGGNIDLAAESLQVVMDKMGKQGFTAEEVRSQLDGYRSAMDEVAFQQQMAAQAQGLFGEQAMATSQKLAAQKASADGLRQSVQALNDVHRAALGGMIGFEAAIDAAAEAARQNAGVLTMSGGQLDLNGAKARTAAAALQDLGTKTDQAASSARESGASWDSVSAILERGRSSLISSAQAMGLSSSEARRLARSIIDIPNKTTYVKGNLQDLEAKLAAAKSELRSVPDSRRAEVRARIDQLQAAVNSARAALNSVQSKTVFINTYHTDYVSTVRSAQFGIPGDLLLRASGGPIRGPGTGTSDDVPVMASNGEYMVRAMAVQKYGTPFLDAINSGTLQTFAKGGKISDATRQARGQMGSDLTVSHFGRMTGRKRSEFASAMDNPNNLGDLAQSLNKWRGLIKGAFSGGVEKRLLGALDRTGRELIKQEKALTKVNSALDGARDKLKGLRDKASQVRDSVASGITGSANITGSVQGGGRTSVGRIMNDLLGSRDKAVSFAGALKELRARGLNSGSLQEIANAGIDGGGLATAEALMSARGSDLQRINQLRSQITSAAGAAGQTTADAMYGAGIKAAERLVKGLEKQQDRLQKTMERVAAAMERTLERALGIKGKAHGGITGAAGGGPRSALTWVGEQGPELVNLPFGSRVRTAGDSRRMAAGMGSGGSTPIVIHLQIGGREFGELVVDTARREVRTRGGNVQAVLGR
ncbi:phage tail protein [Streptomyces syringium]|uniref:phage tail protein n=1 Tax=Streptomyces syringium TaxID=76729 RepID=UPI0033D2CDCC